MLRSSWRADERRQVEERPPEVLWLVDRYESRDAIKDAARPSATVRDRHAEVSREEAQHIRIDERFWLVKGEDAHGRGDVGANAGEGAQVVERGWHRSFVPIDESAA